MKQVITNGGVANAPAMNTLVAGGLIASLLIVEGAVLSDRQFELAVNLQLVLSGISLAF